MAKSAQGGRPTSQFKSRGNNAGEHRASIRTGSTTKVSNSNRRKEVRPSQATGSDINTTGNKPGTH